MNGHVNRITGVRAFALLGWISLASVELSAQTCSGNYTGDLSGAATLEFTRNGPLLTLYGAIPSMSFDIEEDAIPIAIEFRGPTGVNQQQQFDRADLLLVGEAGECYFSGTYEFFPLAEDGPARLSGRITIGELPENANVNASSNANANSGDGGDTGGAGCGGTSAATLAFAFVGLSLVRSPRPGTAEGRRARGFFSGSYDS